MCREFEQVRYYYSTDEDPGLWIESFAIIKNTWCMTKYKLYLSSEFTKVRKLYEFVNSSSEFVQSRVKVVRKGPLFKLDQSHFYFAVTTIGESIH